MIRPHTWPKRFWRWLRQQRRIEVLELKLESQRSMTASAQAETARALEKLATEVRQHTELDRDIAHMNTGPIKNTYNVVTIRGRAYEVPMEAPKIPAAFYEPTMKLSPRPPMLEKVSARVETLYCTWTVALDELCKHHSNAMIRGGARQVLASMEDGLVALIQQRLENRIRELRGDNP